MRTGENNRDITALEKKAGQRAAKNLRASLKKTLLPFKDTGAMLKSLRVTPKMRYDALDNLTINATRVVFIQHYGFEKTASNRAKYTLKPKDHFNNALSKTNALDTLADDIGNLRAEEVISKINW